MKERKVWRGGNSRREKKKKSDEERRRRKTTKKEMTDDERKMVGKAMRRKQRKRGRRIKEGVGEIGANAMERKEGKGMTRWKCVGLIRNSQTLYNEHQHIYKPITTTTKGHTDALPSENLLERKRSIRCEYNCPYCSIFIKLTFTMIICSYTYADQHSRKHSIHCEYNYCSYSSMVSKLASTMVIIYSHTLIHRQV